MKVEIKQAYKFDDSLDRIDRILDGYIKPLDIKDANEIKRAKIDLSPKTGAYVIGTVLVITFFVESNVKLINKLKVYRAFTSEVISLLSANEDCEDIYTYGNKIIAIFDTPFKNKIEKVIDNAASICSLTDIINKKAKNSGYPKIKVSTGVHYGEMLMLSFSEYDARDNHPEKEVQYISPIISRAESLCNRGFEAVTSRIYITDVIFNNLKLDYQKFFKYLDEQKTSYCSNLNNIQMNNWLSKN